MSVIQPRAPPGVSLGVNGALSACADMTAGVFWTKMVSAQAKGTNARNAPLRFLGSGNEPLIRPKLCRLWSHDKPRGTSGFCVPEILTCRRIWTNFTSKISLLRIGHAGIPVNPRRFHEHRLDVVVRSASRPSGAVAGKRHQTWRAFSGTLFANGPRSGKMSDIRLPAGMASDPF